MIERLLTGLFIILCATPALAAELTLERCVQLGLEQNDALKAMASEVEIDHQDANIAYTELFPSISLESIYLLRDQPPHFTLGSGLFGPGLPPEDTQVEGEKDHYSVGVKLDQTLFAGGRLLRTHEARTLLFDARRAQYEDQKSQLTSQIKKSFYTALTRRYELAAAAEAVSSQTEELRIRKELLQSGKATRDELMATESSLLFAKADRLRVEQSYLGALDDLQALIGTDEQVTLVEPKLYATLSPDFAIRDDQVLSRRHDMKRLQAQIQAADKNVQVAKSGYFPELTLEASYLNQRETDITEPEIWQAGLRLDWHLFEAGRTDAEVAKAKAETLRLKHTQKSLERSISNEIKASLRLVRENESLVEAHKLQLMAAEKEHAYRLELYRAGKLKALDIVISRTKLATTNAQYRAAINNLRTALVALETTLAEPLDGELMPQDPYTPDLKPLEETLSTPATESPQAATAVAGDYYAVQLGAFRSTEKASHYLRALREKHPGTAFEAVTIDGWQKIRATRFSSRASAAAALTELGGKGFIVHASADSR